MTKTPNRTIDLLIGKHLGWVQKRDPDDERPHAVLGSMIPHYTTSLASAMFLRFIDPSTPDFVKSSISEMANFQRRLFEVKHVRAKILRMIESKGESI